MKPYRKCIAAAAFSAALMIVMLSAVSGASLFQTSSQSMFADDKARDVGDLVTLIIVEQAQASQSAGTDSGQSTSTEVGPGLGVLSDLIPLLGFGASRSFDGGGSTSRSGSLDAQLTTRVVEVYPNDTLKIEGRQSITVNDEEQEIVVSGVVRKRDIQPDNSIVSPLVADANIEFAGSGMVDDDQKQGIITRILQWLF